MTLNVIRGLFVFACVIMGVIWTNHILDTLADPASTEPSRSPLLLQIFGGAIGASVAGSVLFSLRYFTQAMFERLFPVFVAVSTSMMLGYFAARYIMLIYPPPEGDLSTHVFLTSTMLLLFGMVGIYVGLTKASNWESLVKAVKTKQIEYGNPKIIDTSVIIDGRIADIVQSGFIEGTLIVPRFVLQELQHIADSADDLRRKKGRRGLDILKSLQDDGSRVALQVIDDDPQEVKEVDQKLIRLARQYNAKVVTNDFNLNKVAQIEGVEVLNINDLTNALKTVALPDEHMDVKIVNPGKESMQGVGYLEDGTMVVVDGGREFIGKTVSVIVTSVLQTERGRMIFTRLQSGVMGGASSRMA